MMEDRIHGIWKANRGNPRMNNAISSRYRRLSAPGGILSLCLYLCLLLVHSSGCSKNGNPAAPAPPAGAGVYVLNEGNFSRGNSTLTYYLPDSNRVYDDMFFAVNGRKLGDTGNSIGIRNGKAYIVVNGSNKIEVIDAATQKSVATIPCPAGASPRHIAFSSDAKAYVSNLYDNSVSIVDLASNTVTGRIPVGNNPEEMLIDGGYLYVTDSGFGKGRSVSVIDAARDTVVATLAVSDNPIHIRRWNTSTALVLCGGDYGNFNDPNDDTPGKLFFIDLPTRRVTDSLLIGGHPFEAAVDNNDHFYFLGSAGVYRIDLKAKSLSPNPFIAGAFYTVAFDARRNQLYVTDPKDYVQPGSVNIYDLNGGLVKSFTAGVNPGWVEPIP